MKVGSDMRILLLAAVMFAAVALIVTTCQTGCTSSQKKGYRATLRVWRCGELVQETVTEEEIEDEIPCANGPVCGPAAD